MKKNLLITAILCSTTVLSVIGRDYTVDDLTGGTWLPSEAQYRYYPTGTYGEDTGTLYEALSVDLLHATNAYGLTFEKQDENTILIKGMFGGLMDIPFTLSENVLTMDYNATSGGDHVYVVNNPANRPDIRKIILSPCDVYINSYNYNIFHSYSSNNWESNPIEEMTGTQDGNGNYDLSISFNNKPVELQITYTNGRTEKQYVDSYQFDMFKPTLTISDTQVRNGVSTDREYRGEFEFTGANTFQMAGLGGQYAGLTPELVSLNRGLFYIGSVGWDDYYEYGYAQKYQSDASFFNGEFDLKNRTALLYTTGYTLSFDNSWSTWGDKTVRSFKTREVIDSNRWQDNIRGTVTPIEDSANHRHDVDYWITNDGSCTTWLKLEFRFNDWQSVFQTSQADANVGLIKNTTFIPDQEIEVTLDADVEIEARSDDEESLKFSGTISANKNDYFVDSYDLYLIKGTHTSMAGNDKFNHEEWGHEEAICLNDYDDAKTTARSNGTADRRFSVTIPNDVLLSIDPEWTGQYTVYAKANYTNSHVLKPTFHDLTPVNSNYITAIAGVYSDDVNTEVEYFNLQGVRVAEPEQGGVYLRRCGTKVEKVVIR